MNPPRQPPTPPLRLVAQPPELAVTPHPSHKTSPLRPIKDRVIDDVCAIISQEIHAAYITPEDMQRFLQKGEISIAITDAGTRDYTTEGGDALYIDQIDMPVAKILMVEMRTWLVKNDLISADAGDIDVVIAFMREKLTRKLEPYDVDKLKNSNYSIWLTAPVAINGKRGDGQEHMIGANKFGSIAEVPTFKKRREKKKDT